MVDDTNLLKAMVAAGPLQPEKLESVMPAMLLATMEGKITRAEYYQFMVNNLENMNIYQFSRADLALNDYHYDDEGKMVKHAVPQMALGEYFAASTMVSSKYTSAELSEKVSCFKQEGETRQMVKFCAEFYMSIENLVEAEVPGIEFRKDAGTSLIDMAVKNNYPLDKFDHAKFGLSQQEFKNAQAKPKSQYPELYKKPELTLEEMDKASHENKNNGGSGFRQMQKVNELNENLKHLGYPKEELNKEIEILMPQTDKVAASEQPKNPLDMAQRGSKQAQI